MPAKCCSHAGDAADSAYVVQEGSFGLVPHRAEGEAEEIVAGPGALLGELAMITPTKRLATATALEPSTVIRISRGLFLKMLEGYPETARKLRDAIGGAHAINGRARCEDVRAGDGKKNREVSGADSAAAQTSTVSVTGTWSEGCAQPRASLAILMPPTRSARAGEVQIWSSRRPLVRGLPVGDRAVAPPGIKLLRLRHEMPHRIEPVAALLEDRSASRIPPACVKRRGSSACDSRRHVRAAPR